MTKTQAKIYLRIMLAAGLLFGVFFALGAGLGQIIHRMLPASAQDSAGEFLVEGKRTNILVLGVDARPGQDNVHSRADTILLVSLDPALKKAAVVSIPRDTRVKIKGNTDKINAANVYGGPELVEQLVGELLATRVDYYVEMDFTGFKNIIDTLGGVEVNVPQRMYKPLEDIDLQPGLQRLNGRQALGFVRFRDYIYGDIGRTEAQQQFLKALAKEILQPKTIPRLPGLVDEVAQSLCGTNLSVTEMAKLAAWAPAFSSDAVNAQTVPGAFYEERDAQGELVNSYWVVDQKLAGQLLESLFSGQTLTVIEGSSSNYPNSEAGKSTAAGEKTTGASGAGEQKKSNGTGAETPKTSSSAGSKGQQDKGAQTTTPKSGQKTAGSTRTTTTSSAAKP